MPKSKNRSQGATNGWDVLRDVVHGGFNSGYALVILCGTIFLGALGIVIQKLDSKDLKDLIVGSFNSWLPALGWLLFVIGTVIYVGVIRWMRRQYQGQIDYQRELIDRFLPEQKKDNLKLE
jgi:hypothetical protein